MTWYLDVQSIPSLPHNQGLPCHHCRQPVYGPRSKVVALGNHPWPPTGNDRNGFGWYVCLSPVSDCAAQVICYMTEEGRELEKYL